MRWVFSKALFEEIRRHLSWVRSKHRLERSIPNMVVGYRATALECEFEGGNRLGDYSEAYASALGRFTYYGAYVRIKHASIGRFCSIGSYVSVGLWSHPVGRNVSTHPLFHSSIGQAGGVCWIEERVEEKPQRVNIGHDVWIGDFSIIRSGISIGNGAVIGAGAVVTKDVPAYAIVAGVPARILRMRFSEEEIAWLQDISWWYLPEQKLRKLLPVFGDLARLRATEI